MRSLQKAVGPNVVKLIEAGVARLGNETRYFVALEYLEGRDLARAFREAGGHFDEQRLIDILVQIVTGLQTVHSQKIVHRDLKPANVFLTDTGVIKLLDFGLVKMLDYTTLTTLPGQPIGTPLYIAPEILRGDQVDYRADFYSLGVLTYHLITGGQYPFTAQTPLELYAQVVNNPPTPPTRHNNSISSEFENLVLTLLSKQPFERNFNHAELGEAIRATPLQIPAEVDRIVGTGIVPYEKRCFFRLLQGEKGDVERFVRTGGSIDGIEYPANFLPRHRKSFAAFRDLGLRCLLDPVTYRLPYSTFALTKGLVNLPYVLDPNKSMPDVIEVDGDAESWQAMLRQFDALNPIIEEPDTLDQLHLYLWNAGVQDTTLLIEQCVGRMLNSFDMPSPQSIRALGRDLRSLFFAAPRRSNWVPIGHVLTLNDLAFDQRASKDTRVLTGQVPKFEHLRRGYFRDRQQIFQSLWTAFTGWLSTLDSFEFEPIEKIPVFWISGRSGEGKSVLLLQLIAEFLKSVEAASTVQLKSGNDLPRLIETVPEPRLLSDPAQSRVFAVIDDVYDLRDRESWGDEIGNACSLRTPPLAILTCGPTEQREQFTSQLGDQFNVAHFEVPTLDLDECLEFLAWYEARTGKSRDLNNITTENALLVLFMFELAQGMRLPEFAQRFKRRLLRLNLFEAARTILAVNALYIDAPLALIQSDNDRDALARLCERDQLHFRLTPSENNTAMEGIRLAHAHLAWLLFIEWVEPPTTLAKAWARELAKAMLVMENESASSAVSGLLARLQTTTRLSDTTEGDSLPPTANRTETIRELYRVHIGDHGGPSFVTLSSWLDLTYKIPELKLDPDPARCAIAELSNPLSAPYVSGSVAAQVWLISESRLEPEAEGLRNAAKEFLLGYSNNSGVGLSLRQIFNKRLIGAKEFIASWIALNPVHPQSYYIIATLLAANPESPKARRQAINWFVGNTTLPQSGVLISALVAANPANAEVLTHAFGWLNANPTHPQALWLTLKSVVANPGNAKVLSQAADWLDANPTHPQVHTLLPPLVKAGRATPRIIDLVLSSIKQEHYESLLPALARAVTDNLENAVSYLNGNYAEERKRLVCELIGKGMKPDPDVFAHFLYQGDHNITSDHLHIILKSAVIEEAESDNLNAIIAQWLNENFREPVYWEMLDAFKPDYYRWVRIEGLGYLRSEIEQDFEALSTAQ